MTHFCRLLCIAALWLFSSLCLADSMTTWVVVPDKSQLTVRGTMNDAPVTATFKSFSGEIQLDGNKLENSRARIVVDMTSVSTSYTEIAETLKLSDWFNVKTYPEAIFVVDNFVKTGEKTYDARGKLTVRDKTLPVSASIELKRQTATEIEVMGKAMLKRTAFGVGGGEWGDTKDVADDVEVKYTLIAIKKPVAAASLEKPYRCPCSSKP